MTATRVGLRRDTSGSAAPIAVALLVIAAFVIGIFLSGILAPPRPADPICELFGVTSPANTLIELRTRTGDGGAVVVASVISDDAGRYSVAATCRPGTPFDARASHDGYFVQLLSSLPFSTDQATRVEWNVTLIQAP